MTCFIIISVFVICNILAGLEGFVRAHYEDYLYFTDRKHRNLHGWYMAIRAIMLLPFSLVIFEECSLVLDSPWLWYLFTGLFYAACAMAYSFLYLGVLYTQRNNLAPEIYKKRFFASKEKGENKNAAKMEFGFALRAFYFLLACSFIAGIILEIVEK